MSGPETRQAHQPAEYIPEKEYAQTENRNMDTHTHVKPRQAYEEEEGGGDQGNIPAGIDAPQLVQYAQQVHSENPGHVNNTQDEAGIPETSRTGSTIPVERVSIPVLVRLHIQTLAQRYSLFYDTQWQPGASLASLDKSSRLQYCNPSPDCVHWEGWGV